MNHDDRSQHELQINTQMQRKGLWERWTQAIFSAWLQQYTREVSKAKSTVHEHLQGFARLW